MTRMQLTTLAAAALLFAGCGEKDTDDSGHEHSGHDDTAASDDTASADDSASADEIAIAGSYTDSWGGTHEISSTLWDQGYASFAISQYDNGAGYAVAQNASTNEYNPDLWSRFDWTWSGEELYYCQIAYDAASEQDAMSAGPADSSQLSGGCNGFDWTMMTAN